MMSIIPKAADTVLLPVWTPKHENSRMTIEWKQTFTKTGDYYCIVAKDTSQEGGQVVVFIQAEWYNDSVRNCEYHLTRLGAVKDGYVEVKLDKRFQYGQQSADGTLRFIVYHDKSRKIYQHRFQVTTKAMVFGGFAEQVAKLWDEKMAGFIASTVKSYVGHELHTF